MVSLPTWHAGGPSNFTVVGSTVAPGLQGRQEPIPRKISRVYAVLYQKSFAKSALLSQAQVMVQPLAIVLNDRVVVGAQLEQRLEALDYRVKVTDNPAALSALAQEHKPLVVLMDLSKDEHLRAATLLLQQPDTRHVPVLGFAPEIRPELQSRANSAGIVLVVTDSAVLQHLKPLLDQALQVE